MHLVFFGFCTPFLEKGPPKIIERGPFDPHWPVSRINPGKGSPFNLQQSYQLKGYCSEVHQASVWYPPSLFPFVQSCHCKYLSLPTLNSHSFSRENIMPLTLFMCAKRKKLIDTCSKWWSLLRQTLTAGSGLACENGWHFAMPLLVSQETKSEERAQKFHSDYMSLSKTEWCFWLVKGNSRSGFCQVNSMEFLCSLLRWHFAGKPVVASLNSSFF